jgi:hypothetical protein
MSRASTHYARPFSLERRGSIPEVSQAAFGASQHPDVAEIAALVSLTPDSVGVPFNQPRLAGTWEHLILHPSTHVTVRTGGTPSVKAPGLHSPYSAWNNPAGQSRTQVYDHLLLSH